MYNKDLSLHEKLIKIYTLETSFYKILNRSLAIGKEEQFETYIKTLLLERNKLKSFSIEINKYFLIYLI